MQKGVHQFTFKPPYKSIHRVIPYNHRLSEIDRIANQLGSIQNLETNLTSINSLLWNLSTSNLYIISSLIIHPVLVRLHKYQTNGHGGESRNLPRVLRYPRVNPSKCVWKAAESYQGVLARGRLIPSQEPILLLSSFPTLCSLVHW